MTTPTKEREEELLAWVEKVEKRWGGQVLIALINRRGQKAFARQMPLITGSIRRGDHLNTTKGQ